MEIEDDLEKGINQKKKKKNCMGISQGHAPGGEDQRVMVRRNYCTCSSLSQAEAMRAAQFLQVVDMNRRGLLCMTTSTYL